MIRFALISFLRRPCWRILVPALLTMPAPALANGADLPPEVLLQGFVKVEDDRLHLLVRVPLVLLASFTLPKRGPGYLDLANIDDPLHQAAASTSRQIGLQEDGVALAPAVLKSRISVLADRSFLSYESALAHLDGPPLPNDTNLFWNQGFFDAHLEYPIRSAHSRFSISVNIAPELGQRLKLQLEFLRADGAPLRYKLPGNTGWVALDPRWYEAAWLFIKVGFVDSIGFDRFAFLLCLVAPFRRLRSLLAVVLMSGGLQALMATALVQRMVADSPLLEPLLNVTLAASIVLLAIGNLAVPSLRRRWFIGAIVGAVGGASLGHSLDDALQLAGEQRLAAIVAFNLGALLAQVAGLGAALAGLRLLFARLLMPAFGILVLSLILGHMAWHWMADQGHELIHQLGHVGWSPVRMILMAWLLPGVAIGALAWLLPRGFGGAPMPSLLAARLENR